MGFGGSASAMIASIKSNTALRRNKKQTFTKKREFSNQDIQYVKLNKKENDDIRQENLKSLHKTQTQSRILAILLIGPLASIFYVIWLLIEYILF